jgi:hypothetical protein
MPVKNESKSSNASDSAFGWEFQSNAAIILMLTKISQVSKVKVEGDTEDIEITYSNGKLLMSQVKSAVNPFGVENVRGKLDKGLKTLNNAAKNPNTEELYFVTNSSNPFNDIESMPLFSSPTNFIPYNSLSPNSQDIIKEICAKKGYSFDFNKLTICVIQFYGDDINERDKVVKNLTQDFLNNIGIYSIPIQDILKLWQNSFFINATQKTRCITKGQMIWPVIAFLFNIDKENSKLTDYDENDVEENLKKYKSIIDTNTEGLSLFHVLSMIIMILH